MTTHRKSQVQVRVTSRTVAVRLYGHVIDGWPAALIIAIIIAAKLTYSIMRLTFVFLAWAAPILFRFALRVAAEAVVLVREAYRSV